MGNIIIGIDNGVSGAIACITEKTVDVNPMPIFFVKKKKGKKRVYDVQEIVRVLKKAKATHVFIEEARSMPKQGVVSTFNTGRGYGLIEGIVAALEYPYTIVVPRVWQKILLNGVGGDTKSASVIVAKRLFPKVSLLATKRCRKENDGLSDALLIAEYGRRQLQEV